MEIAKCPSVGKWVYKLWYSYTMEYHRAVKKERSTYIYNNINNFQKHYVEQMRPDIPKKNAYSMIPSIRRCGTAKINLWNICQTLVVSARSEVPTVVH